jgi:hypothetical protein
MRKVNTTEMRKVNTTEMRRVKTREMRFTGYRATDNKRHEHIGKEPVTTDITKGIRKYQNIWLQHL